MANVQKSTKVKKKIWLPIIAPAIFNSRPVGETCVWDINSAVGKHISVNLMELTGDIKSQSYTLELKINKVAENKAHTSAIGYLMSPASVRRLVRRNKDKIDLSFVVETADNVPIRIKPFMITKNAANLSVLHKLRVSTIELLARTVKKLSFEAVMQMLSQYKLQQEIKRTLNKIYPLKIFEIRSLKLTSEKPVKVSETKKKEEEPEEIIEENAEESETQESVASETEETSSEEESTEAPEEE